MSPAHRRSGQEKQPQPVKGTPATLPTFEQIMGRGGHRCGICCRVFPVLVDGVLCIRCDAITFPHHPAAAS